MDSLAVAAGRRPHQVIVQRASDSRDSTTGEIAAAFAPLDPVQPKRWGQVKPLAGRELAVAREQQADVTHEVRLRWDRIMGTATPRMRIQHRGRTLEILSVLNLEERNVTLVFLCKEQV